MTLVFVQEGVLTHDSTEDGGMALIGAIVGPDDSTTGMFVRVQSWDEEGKHEQMRPLLDKRVRVTIEVLDDAAIALGDQPAIVSPLPPAPVQPLVTDSSGMMRFRANGIVVFLLQNSPIDMTHLSHIDFSDEDRAQFAELLGYDMDSYVALPYVSRDRLAQALGQGQEEA